MVNSSDVVVIGDIFADMISHVISYPANGEGTYGTPLEIKGGGTGGNVAAGLATLGVPTTIVSRLGDDDNGRFLKKDMASYGVNTNGIVLDPEAPTGSVVITVDPEGERTIFALTLDTSYSRLSLKDAEIIDKVKPKSIFFTGVLLGLQPAEDTLFAVAEKYKGKARLYFDPNLRHPADAIPPNVKDAMQRMSELCDVVLAGDSEMEALELQPQDNQLFIVKCGKAGSKLLDKDGKIVFTIPATEHVAHDATGAGDTFAAAYICAEGRGYSVREAMEFATVASGISVTRSGARSMPTNKEIEDYINNNS